MDKYSFLNSIHISQIEEMYQKYLNFPDSIDPQWRIFFQGFDFANESYTNDIYENCNSKEEYYNSKIIKETKVIQLIYEYKSRGHLFTKTNPVRQRRNFYPNLDISRFGLNEEDMNDTFEAGKSIGLDNATLKEIIHTLKRMYCESIGIEYMHITKPEENEWIQNWINKNSNTPNFSNEKKKQILNDLNKAVCFEQFLHTKYVGKKRFSLEGNESLIPSLKEIISHGSNKDVKEIILGMAHRGRLNVLANVFNKDYKSIFTEFEEKDYRYDIFEGDVKYHLGWSTEVSSNNKKIKLNIAPNPSHLETVNSVVEGISRAKIDNNYNNNFNSIIPILIHGDAAISGQGIVYEVLQMSQLEGYKTGGTIHIVVNNQIGFTTNYTDSRSTIYCTDIGKITLSPILHVNADDVEAVIHATQFAVEYRMRFNKDIFLDLLGYRKYGHNEGDEPRFTQPLLYKIITKHPNVKDIYSTILLKNDIISAEDVNKLDVDFKNVLEEHFNEAKNSKNTEVFPIMQEEWKDFKITFDDKDILEIKKTNISKNKIDELTKTITSIPIGKTLVKKIEKLLEDRRNMISKDSIDWGMAENLAYASLLDEGYNIRITGQDVERGTFTHRHAVLKAEDSEEKIIPLKNVSEKVKFDIYNSLLSEYGAMGYEYGYAMTHPNTLNIWEAQFGDFCNGAQIIIDQYLCAAEEKWKMQNGLVCFLPHGYEGQGAEHSSGRIERFLQLCAKNNMYVANCTTPSNFFHLLRLQMKRNFKKPLVIFTPKSLLRHPKCISPVKDFINNNFIPVIDDYMVEKGKIKKIVLCSGKFYYDLLQERDNLNSDIAIIRIEQLYPLNKSIIYEIIKSYKNAKDIIWAQEEPENMGPWTHILRHLNEIKFKVLSSQESGIPSAGNSKRWAKKHKEIIDKVFL